MADEYVAQEVAEFTTGSRTPCWRVTMQRPDGELVHHLFPKETLEWRAAEYELDDPAEILDLILHARYAPTEGKTFYDAESTTEAKADYRARVERARQTVRIVPPKGRPNPLDAILLGHGMDPDRIRAKRELVDVRRWIRHGGELPGLQRGATTRDSQPRPLRSL